MENRANVISLDEFRKKKQAKADLPLIQPDNNLQFQPLTQVTQKEDEPVFFFIPEEKGRQLDEIIVEPVELYRTENENISEDIMDVLDMYDIPNDFLFEKETHCEIIYVNRGDYSRSYELIKRFFD